MPMSFPFVQRRIPSTLLALGALLCAALFLPSPASTQDAEEMIPEGAAGFTLQETNVRGPAAAMGVYTSPDEDTGPVQLAVAHGEVAAQLHNRLQNTWSERESVSEVEVDGLTFTSFVSGSDVVVMRYADDRLLMVGGEVSEGESGQALTEQAIALLEAFEPGRIAEWTPPAAEAEAERPTRATEPAPTTEGPRAMQNCGPDMECFMESVTACEAARAAPPPAASARVEYRVEGPTDHGRCRLSFRFTENPNPALVDKSMSFTVDPDASTPDSVRNAVTACLGGDEDAVEAHSCEGGLVGAMGG